MMLLRRSKPCSGAFITSEWGGESRDESCRLPSLTRFVEKYQTRFNKALELTRIVYMHNRYVGKGSATVDSVCSPPCFVHRAFHVSFADQVQCSCGATSDPFPNDFMNFGIMVSFSGVLAAAKSYKSLHEHPSWNDVLKVAYSRFSAATGSKSFDCKF